MMILGVPPEDEPLMLKLTQELFGAEEFDLQRKALSKKIACKLLRSSCVLFAMTEDRRKIGR